MVKERERQEQDKERAQTDDSEPSPERQAELRAAYAANSAAERPPYADVRLVSRGELVWVLSERAWSGEYDAYTVKYVLKPRGQPHTPADLRRVNLGHVALGEVYLRMADLTGANLVFADLSGAHLADARLQDADMGRVNLRGAELNYADLSGAHLREANLHGANLQYVRLTGTRLHGADLGHAVLHGTRMDPATVLSEAHLDAGTWLGDIIWDGALLARINWDQVPRLGDEAAIGQASAAKDAHERLEAYRAAARAYQQLALALQAQGLGDEAGRYAYRGQVLHRRVLWRRHTYGRWLFSLLLAALAGYGYRLDRILIAYVTVVGLAAAAYYALGATGSGPAFSPQQALLVSITAFHGRVFTEPFGTSSPQAWVAAGEAVTGLVIEGVFVAMLVQRFFGGK
jgi:hypothetical protein